MHDPNTPTAMQTPLTHEEKWAEAEADRAAGVEELKRFYWKRAGRPIGPEEDYLPPELWATPPVEEWAA